MFNKTSIYALNKKDPNAIVYPTATGEIIRVTREDFSSEEEFLALKAWSDEDFHKEDNRDVVEGKHMICIDDLAEAVLAVPAVDEEMEQEMQISEKRRKASNVLVKLKDKLTETQFRRLWMYRVEGMTEAEIARKEGVGQRRVSTSITDAIKKLENFSQKQKNGG